MQSVHEYGTKFETVCDGTACHVRKSTEIIRTLENELGLSEEKKTSDELGNLYYIEYVEYNYMDIKYVATYSLNIADLRLARGTCAPPNMVTEFFLTLVTNAKETINDLCV